MGTIRDDESKVLAVKLLTYVAAFYIVIYAMCGVLVWGFDESFAGSYPFRTRDNEFGVSSDTEKVSFLAVVLTMALSPILVYFIVRSSRHAWDYATSTSLLHFVLTCAVDGRFPTNWVWWITMVIGTAYVSVAGELACYKLRDLRSIHVEH